MGSSGFSSLSAVCEGDEGGDGGLSEDLIASQRILSFDSREFLTEKIEDGKYMWPVP